MPISGVISNPQGVFDQAATIDGAIVVWRKNVSGGVLRTGDVVVCNAAQSTVTTTTTASNKLVYGVVGEAQGNNITSSTQTFAADANVPVVIYGPARINIGTNTVAAGDNLSSSATAKVAAKAADAGTIGALQALIGSFVAVATEANTAKDANNTIRCFVTKA